MFSLPRIPLIEDLLTGPLPLGSQLMVEYDPASQWYNASIAITASWLRTGGNVIYFSYAQPPDDIRAQLKALGLELDHLEKEKKFNLWDSYTTTLGQKPKENSYQALKVAELSIWIAEHTLKGSPDPDMLWITDDESTLARFNDEKAWVEFELTRTFPSGRQMKVVAIAGFMAGVHSDWAYKRLEGGADGLIEFKLDRSSDPPRNLMRITSMRKVGFDGRWQVLKVAENFEVTVEKQ